MNVLRDECAEQELEAVLKDSKVAPLVPPLGSECWRNPILKQWLRPLSQRAVEECGLPLPVLTEDMYGEFNRTGKRLSFERAYFERRRSLARAAIALLLCDKHDPLRDEIRKSLVAKLTDVASEASWVLPASLTEQSGIKAPNGIAPLEIDLFCAETANLMAEMLDVFGPVLPADLQGLIRKRLQSDIFENFLRRRDEFWWRKTSNNWNAVCHQGVVGAALSQVGDPHLLAEILVVMRESLGLFLRGFTPDGGCTEGPAYWGYGFGWFATLNEQLEHRTGGRLSLFEGDDLIPKMARFGPAMVLPGNHLVNFSDCVGSAVLRPALLCYLGERLDEPLCRNLGLKNYRTLLAGVPALDEARADFMQFSRMFLHFPKDPGASPLPDGGEGSDLFLEDLGVVVAHGKDASGREWHFAAKGGNNAEHHNHNDCGSYLLNINETPMIIEIGAPEYVKNFFLSDRRYEFLAARTLGHSLPIINGGEQAAGRNYQSEIQHCDLGADTVTLRIDLTRCYSEEARCRRLIRTFVFDKKRGALTVTDEFENEEAVAVETAVITAQTVIAGETHVTIEGPLTRLRLRALEGSSVTGVKRLAYSDHQGDRAAVQRIVIEPSQPSRSARISYVVD